MEEIEEANKAAVENCHKVLSIIAQPHENQTKFRFLAVETEKTVKKFQKIVKILGKEAGHARARIVKQNRATNLIPNGLIKPENGPKIEQNHVVSKGFELFRSNFNEGFVQENGSISGLIKPENGPKIEQNDVVSKGFELFRSNLNEGFGQENGSVSGKSCLSLGNDLSLGPTSSNGKNPSQITNYTNPNVHYQLLRQQQQQMRHQAEMMYKRSNSSSGISLKFENSSYTPTMSSTRSFISSLSVDGSVASLDANGFSLVGVSCGSDPNLSQFKKRCYGARSEDGGVKCGGGLGKCHCSKKRKHRVKRTIKVPAISNKLADIPSDDYSWRKYGQKPIKGSPHPRGYYKCSTVRGCPARKHVERCLEEPSMLIITYEGDHSHHQVPVRSANA
ncbi:hypothetical protein RND81_02G008100 [Saponaria officinalis]